MAAVGPITGIRAAANRLVPPLLLGVLPVMWLAWFLQGTREQGIFALDFHHAYWPAARDVLHGSFEYPQDIGYALATGDPFIYPPLTAVMLVPFALLPRGVADATYTILSCAALFGGMRLLGVTDWRCYGIVLWWLPVMMAVQVANMSLVLVLLLGVVWATRGRPFWAGVSCAILISCKLFVWPVLVWMVLTKRYVAAAWSVLLIVTLNAAAWLVTDAGGVLAYFNLVRRASALQSERATTIPTLAQRLGAPAEVGELVMVATVAALLFICWKIRDDDASTLAVIVVVALIASPIVWLHYLSILVVPIALKRPRLSWPWFLPLVYLGSPDGQDADTVVALLFFAAIVAIVRCSSPRLRGPIAS